MNNLSWLLYLADVCASVGNFLTFVIILCAVIFLGTVFIMTNELRSDEELRRGRQCLLYSSVVFFTAFFFNTVTPSKETVYAIAVSEMGEEVLQSETGGKALEALNNWLDDQISDEPEQEEKD